MARPRKTDGDDGSEPKPARTRKTTSAKKTTASSSKSPKKTTTARKSTAKAAASASRSEPSHDDIARRAYEISQGPDAGSDEDNWHRAVRELRGDSPDPGEPWAKLGSGSTDSLTSD